MAINAGIERIVCREDYPDDLGRALLDASGVRLEVHPAAKR
jgi:deoxycytidylate deaminase